MAKEPKGLKIEVPADFEIEAHGHKLTVAELETMSPKAISYLLANGFKQSLTDAAAFTKEQKDGKSAAEIEEMAAAKRQSRFDAILAGEVGAVGGTRATPMERFMRDIAEERVRAIAVAKGVPMPKGDVLKAAIAKVTEKFHGDIKAEAEARMATAKAAADVAGDILG